MKGKYMAYVGSYSYTGNAKGITVYDVDVEKGVFRERCEMEVNNSSFNPRSGRQNAAKNVARWLEIARAHRLPIILGSDAHIYYDVGDVSMAEKMIKEANYPEELVLNASLEGLNYILNRR